MRSSDTQATDSLHIETHGEGPSLGLAHGFGGSARNFLPQVRALRGQYRIVTFDARGHARSPASTRRADYTLPGAVRDWERVLRRVPADRWLVGGLSMGAVSALSYAIEGPRAALRGLVLASPPLGDADSRRWALRFAEELESGALPSALKAVATLEGSPIAPDDFRLVARGFAEHPREGLILRLRALLAEMPPIDELAQRSRQLRVPVLVVAGERDERARLAGTRLAEALPDARFHVIPDAGHVVNLSRPAAFNALLESFLQTTLPS